MAERGTGLTVKPLGPLAAAVTRLFQAPANTIRGIETSDWFGPLQPVSPIAPSGTQPRGMQYVPGQNLIYTPRPDAEYTAAQLRALGTYFLARVCIENVKDIIADLPRQIVNKPQPGESTRDTQKRGQGDAMLKKLNALFDYPDAEHNWSEWVRPLLEDMLVVDAGSVLLRRNAADELVDLRVIRGDLITRYIDEQGFTPMDGPAYAQLWFGIPMVNLTVDQLVYKPRNIVIRNTDSSQLYGMSPTEQGADEIVIGQNRMAFVKAYYTDGVIPDLLQVAPADTTSDKILEQMMDFNSAMAGQLAKRRGLRTIQGFTEKGDDKLYFPKEALLADPFDDLHIRKICFTYGTSPQRLLKQMNRASAEAGQNAAEEEGTLPWVKWLKGVVDTIIQRRLGATDYEITFDTTREPDLAKLSTAQKTWVSCGVKTIDEVRNDNGDDPFDLPETMEPIVLTATGPIPLKTDSQIDQAKKKQDAGIIPAKTTPGEGEGGEGEGAAGGEGDGGSNKPPASKRRLVPRAGQLTKLYASDEEVPSYVPSHKRAQWREVWNGAYHKAIKDGKSTDDAEASAFAQANSVAGPSSKKKVSKAQGARLAPHVLTPQSHAARVHIATEIAKVFRRQKDRVGEEAGRILKKHGYEPTPEKGRVFRKVDQPDPDKIAQEIYAAIEAEFGTIPDEIAPSLEEALRSGAAEGMAQLGVSDASLISASNDLAASYARERAAEMVGMRITESGELVPNPNAEWVISDTTRDRLREIIAQAFEQETPISEIVSQIQEADAFSDARAETIARTEVQNAQVKGNFELWSKSGLVTHVTWTVSQDNPCDDCLDNDGEEVELGEEFPSGDLYPPVHPNCQCVIFASAVKDSPET